MDPSSISTGINTSFVAEENPDSETKQQIDQYMKDFSFLKRTHSHLKSKLNGLNSELNELMEKNFSKLKLKKNSVEREVKSQENEIESQKEILRKNIENTKIQLSMAKSEYASIKAQRNKIEDFQRITQLERAVKQKDMEINDLNQELLTLRKIQRAHVKTIMTNEDDFHKNEMKEMKSKKVLMEAKIERLLKEGEKCKSLFSKRKEKIRKLEEMIKETTEQEGFVFPPSAESLREKEKEFEKMQEKVEGLKNLLRTSERIQQRELTNLEKRLRSLKVEDSQLDSLVSERKQNLDMLKEKIKDFRANLQEEKNGSKSVEEKKEPSSLEMKEVSEKKENKGFSLKRPIKKKKENRNVSEDVRRSHSIHEKKELSSLEIKEISEKKENKGFSLKKPMKTKENRNFSIDNIVRSDSYGKTLPNSTPFSDRAVLESLYDLQIIQMEVFYDRTHKFIKGFQAFYYSQNSSKTIKGSSNFELNAESGDIEKLEFKISGGDYIKGIAGSVSNKGFVESLILTSNMDIVWKVGEESPRCFRFSLNIEQDEIAICLFGEYSVFYDDEKRNLGSVLSKIGSEIIKQEIQEEIIKGVYHEGKLKVKPAGQLTRLN